MNKKHPFLRLLFIFLSSTTLMLTPAAFGAEQAKAPVEGETSSETQTSEQKPVSETQASSKSAQKDNRSPDVFNPSEEISEDFAVAFPVDI